MIRPLAENERRRVLEAVAQFQPEDPEAPFGDGELWTDAGNPFRLFSVSPNLAEALRRCHPEVAPTVIGRYLGRLEGHGVELSLEGATELGRRCKSGRIGVNEKAATLFLYGRDILGPSIIHIDPGTRRGDACLVMNRNREVLGLARVLVDLPSRGRALEPLTDRGWYLREGG